MRRLLPLALLALLPTAARADVIIPDDPGPRRNAKPSPTSPAPTDPSPPSTSDDPGGTARVAMLAIAALGAVGLGGLFVAARRRRTPSIVGAES